MPLIKSASKKAISKNIKTEMEHGKPQKQASVARKSKTEKPKIDGRKKSTYNKFLTGE